MKIRGLGCSQFSRTTQPYVHRVKPTPPPQPTRRPILPAALTKFNTSVAVATGIFTDFGPLAFEVDARGLPSQDHVDILPLDASKINSGHGHTVWTSVVRGRRTEMAANGRFIHRFSRAICERPRGVRTNRG